MKKFINLFYTIGFKLFLFCLLIILSWLAGAKIIDITKLYVEDSTGVINVMFQHNKFEYESSIYLKNEIETTIENVIAYCLEFESSDHPSNDLTTEKEDDFIYTIIHLAQSYVSNKVAVKSMIDSGYIELTETDNPEDGVEIDGKYYIQKVNEEEIINAYNEHKDDFLDQYRRLVDDSYRETAEYLDSLKGVKYAVVNHKTDTIVSNIEEIDKKSNGTSIRSYFGNNDETLLIVRNAQNPFFEAGTMSDYVDHVNECAQNYKEDFDLYISFGDDFSFRNDVSYYENLHNQMYKKVVTHFSNMMILIAFAFIVVVLIFTLSGKSEKGGKIIPSTLDKLPNDIHLVLNSILYLSLSALYENSMYMLLRSSDIETDYWLVFSPDFYATRANLCFVLIIYNIVAVICAVKRQYILGTIFTNTYIYKLISGFKKSDN